MLSTGQAQFDSRLQRKGSNDSLHAMVQFEKDRRYGAGTSGVP